MVGVPVQSFHCCLLGLWTLDFHRILQKSEWIWWQLLEVWLIQVGVSILMYAWRYEPNVTCSLWESPGVSGPFTAVSLAFEPWTFTTSCKKSEWIWWQVFEVWLIQVGVGMTTYACREEPSVTCWWWASPGVSGPFTAVSSASEPWTFTASCKKVNEFGEVWLIQVGVALTTYACREEPSVTCCLWECIKEQRNRHTFSGF